MKSITAWDRLWRFFPCMWASFFVVSLLIQIVWGAFGVDEANPPAGWIAGTSLLTLVAWPTFGFWLLHVWLNGVRRKRGLPS